MNNYFPGSAAYWEHRYRSNGNSGKGSYGKNAEYKAGILNQFVAENAVLKVIELGCGDGNQVKYFNFPSYIGIDISTTAIKRCKEIFSNDNSKEFYQYKQGIIASSPKDFVADLSLSLDVIFHLVEDVVFENYMHDLFLASSRYVIIYAWDVEGEMKFHVRHRNYTKWIKENIPSFQLEKHIKSDSLENFCDFFIYEKTT